MKQALACAAALALLASLLCFGAASALTGGDVEYTVLRNGSVEITAYTGSAEVLKIPDRINRRRVTGIGEWAFYGCESLTVVAIPEGVAAIGDSAFAGCRNLTVTLPAGSYAERWCAGNGIPCRYPE